MKLLNVLVLAAAMGSLVGSSVSEARDRVDRRQGAQGARARQGIRNDQVTRGEAARIRASGRAIERKEERFENNDGQIGAVEQQRLENLQDRRSRQIHRLKNNDRMRQERPGSAQPVAPVEPVQPDAAE